MPQSCLTISGSTLLAMAVVGWAAVTAHADAFGPVVGTYELLICKGECSFSKRDAVIATATVVLLDHVMSLEEMNRINRLYNFDSHDSNACYAIDRKEGAQSYVGVNEKSISRWTLSGNVVRFDLFRSPDAGYTVEVELKKTLFAGTGRSWGAGMGAPPKEYGPDVVVGRRVGPPDSSKCEATT